MRGNFQQVQWEPKWEYKTGLNLHLQKNVINIYISQQYSKLTVILVQIFPDVSFISKLCQELGSEKNRIYI